MSSNFLECLASQGRTVREEINSLQKSEKLQVFAWLNSKDVRWDEPALHPPHEYFAVGDQLITNSALGEAAYLTHAGKEPVVVSLPGSHFEDHGVTVTWHSGPHGTIPINVTNAFALTEVERIADSCQEEILNYEGFIRWAQRDCRHLFFVRKNLLKYMGTTFIPAVVNQGREILLALNAIAEALSVGDIARHKALCSQYLTGSRITDASDHEKNNPIFDARMTFPHPCIHKSIPCYWHGKIKGAVFRIHFEWPPRFSTRRMFVPYIGPKLTK